MKKSKALLLSLASIVMSGVLVFSGCASCNPKPAPGPGPDVPNPEPGPGPDVPTPDVPEVNYAVGLDIAKTTTAYTLEGKTTMDIPMDDIKVNTMNLDGTVASEVVAEKYSVKYYQGDEELTDLNGVGAGVYQIWASAEVEVAKDVKETKEDFVIVYVLDPSTALALKESETAVYTQMAGKDSISSTWTFTVTYSSGATEEVNLTDKRVTITGLDTKTVTEEGADSKAIVTFDGANPDGTKTTQQVEVPYVITPNDGTETNNYAMNLSAFDALADRTKLAQADMTGANEFITVKDKENFVARTSNGACTSIEAKGEAASVVFAGTGSLTIKFCSTNGSNTSNLAVKKAGATSYLLADGDATIAAANKTAVTGVYQVTGTTSAALTVTFTIAEAGEYIIATNIEATEGTEGLTAPGRASRLLEVTAVDTVKPQQAQLSENSVCDFTAEIIVAAKDATLTAGQEIDGKYITVEGTPKSKVGQKGEFNGTEMVDAIQLGGISSNAFKFDLSKKLPTEKAIIKVYASQSGGGKTGRTVGLYDSTKTLITSQDLTDNAEAKVIQEFTFEVTKAGVYFFGTSAGANVYKISIEFEAIQLSENSVCDFTPEIIVSAKDATLTAGQEIDGKYITVEGTPKSKAGQKGEFNGTEMVDAIQLGGITSNAFKIDLSKMKGYEKATIKVYASQSGGNKTGRTVGLYDSAKTLITSQDLTDNAEAKVIQEFTFEVTKAGVYFFGTSAGANVYKISIEFAVA